MSWTSSRSEKGCVAPANSSDPMSRNAGSLVSNAAESIRMPSAPRSNQNRRTSVNSSRTAGFDQLKSGCSGANRCRYQSPGEPSDSVTLVQAGPPNIDFQLLGGLSPPGPAPRLNQNLSRAGDPGPAATASRNHGCWSEQWLGTMSMMILI